MRGALEEVDREVGARVRERRRYLGLSQTALAEAIGLTFQQVQKYEKGMNRMGASRLQQIADVLRVTPTFFFDGQTKPDEDGHENSQIFAFVASAEGGALIRAFTRIQDKEVRKNIVGLVEGLAK